MDSEKASRQHTKRLMATRHGKLQANTSSTTSSATALPPRPRNSLSKDNIKDETVWDVPDSPTRESRSKTFLFTSRRKKEHSFKKVKPARKGRDEDKEDQTSRDIWDLPSSPEPVSLPRNIAASAPRLKREQTFPRRMTRAKSPWGLSSPKTEPESRRKSPAQLPRRSRAREIRQASALQLSSSPDSPTLTGTEDRPKAALRAAGRSVRLKTKPSFSRGGRIASANEAQSQPLPGDTQDTQQDDPRLKRRKLTRSYSEKRVQSASAYSTPESSPPRVLPFLPSSPEPALEHAPRTTEYPAIHAHAQETREDVKMLDAPQELTLIGTMTCAMDKRAGVSVELSAPPKQQTIPLRSSRHLGSQAQVAMKQSVSSDSLSNRPAVPSTSSAPQRKRLIDALAAQEEETVSSPDDDASMDKESDKESGRISPPDLLSQASKFPASAKAKSTVRAMTTKPGLRNTYSRDRSTMLAEGGDLFGNEAFGRHAADQPGLPLFNFSTFGKTSMSMPFLDDDDHDDDEDENMAAIPSLHALRQAGADNRFADEMSDMMDRVGLPTGIASSLRRGALLELADKMREKDFRRQFRTHSGASEHLFKRLDQEADVIAGFSLIMIAVTLLAASPSSHLMMQLRTQGVAELLSRLLGERRDITVVVQERRHNVTSFQRTSFETLKASIHKLPIWEAVSPTSLSPRTLALKCLDLLLRQSESTAAESEIFSPSIMKVLFSVLSAATTEHQHWDLTSNHADSTDLLMALFMLENLSIHAVQCRSRPSWMRKLVPVATHLLRTALNRPAQQFGELEALTLGIVLNLTNNNSDASAMFVEEGLLCDLTEGVCGAFPIVTNSINDEAFQDKVLQNLVCILGVMINFCVHHPSSSERLYLDGGFRSDSAVGKLVRVFLDYHSKTSEADSIAKVKVNVAFGYLSILLAYLCLHQPVRDLFESMHTKRTIAPLADSIREFQIHREAAARAVDGESSLKNELAATERFERLLYQLEHPL